MLFADDSLGGGDQRSEIEQVEGHVGNQRLEDKLGQNRKNGDGRTR